MVDPIIQALTWENLRDFLNSNFTAALAGALAGALTAQHIADRGKKREETLLELRSTNAAIMVAFIFCNAGIALKKQLVKDKDPFGNRLGIIENPHFKVSAVR